MELEALEPVIREMHGDVRVIKTEMKNLAETQRELTEHQKEANGRTLKLEIETAETRGAVSVSRYLLATLIALMGVGIGIASIVLTIVAKGV